MIRKAKIKDISEIQKLINYFAKQDLMLPRSLNELYDNIRDFWVYEENGVVIGCCALHICWQELAEIKSLAIRKDKQKRGIGGQLTSACINEAKQLGACKIFVLTYNTAFFKRFGFKKIEYSNLPHKIWAECINCPKFPDCKETAMVKVISKC
jgi:amino-acid N-acetyltransferase